MKKIVFALMLAVTMVMFAGCGEELLLDIIGEYGGEVAREIFEEAIEQNQEEIDEFGRQWDESKDELREAAKEEAMKEIDSNYEGEDPDAAKKVAGAGVDVGFGILDALVDMATGDDGLHSPVPEGCYFKSYQVNDNGWSGNHDINVNVSESTPVYAIEDGTIDCYQKYVSYGGGNYLVSYGNMISFTSDKTDDGVYTAVYAHLSAYSDELTREFANTGKTVIPKTDTKQWGSKDCKAKGVSIKTNDMIKGRRVKKGELIGYIGTTGNSSGVHLHFELRRDGNRIEPTDVIEGLK